MGPMLSKKERELVDAIAGIAKPLRQEGDLEPLLRRLGRAKVVMLGAASHGTHEFYEWRSAITLGLMEHYGFKFVAVESDWPPCRVLDAWIHGESEDMDGLAKAMQAFDRWPSWIWANQELMALAVQLRKRKASFYGLDVFSLFDSIEVVLRILEGVDPVLARRARLNYACFEPYQRDELAYAKSLLAMPDGCADKAMNELRELLKARLAGAEREALFDARQNARIVANAEAYYRAMIRGEEESWNVRERHMMETLEALLAHHGPEARGVVWAHNTHVGDYRATQMLKQGLHSLGGLARERWGMDQVALLGMGSYHGRVLASHAWGGAMEVMELPPGRSGSWEEAFHQAVAELKASACLVDLGEGGDWLGKFLEHRGQRAIGVVYHPDHERHVNYVPTSLSNRYDSFVFFDESTELRPLPQSPGKAKQPEAWPQGE